MFRRRKAFRGGGRRPKEPLFWDRAGQNAVGFNSASVVQPLTIFDPTTVSGMATQDLRVTVRRSRFQFLQPITITAAVAGDAYLAAMGLYVQRVGAPARSPLYLAADDQQTDWMWHTTSTNIPAAGSTGLLFATGGANLLDGQDLGSSRVARKLTMEETLIAVFQVVQIAGTAHAAPTFPFPPTCVRSILWQRTMRR